MQAVETLVFRRWTGKTHQVDTYRFANQLSICDGQDAIYVNWCELTATLPDDKIV